MNVLITGAHGFLGRELSYRFQQDGYNVFLSTRDNLNVEDISSLRTFFNKKYIDLVVHAATSGGSRTKNDNPDVYINNLTMFQNLYMFKDSFGKMINFSSGADFGRARPIVLAKEEEIITSMPSDYYGLSKNIIASCIASEESNIFNLRLFGCFGALEDDSRLIKTCIVSALKNEKFVLHEDKLMDYFYVGDLYEVLQHYVTSDFSLLKRDVNLCYDTKYSLFDIVSIIGKTVEKKIDLVFSGNIGNEYTGDSSKLKEYNINLHGLEKGIEEVVEALRNV